MKYCFLANIIKRRLLKKVEEPHKGVYMPLSRVKHFGFLFDASLPEIEPAVNKLKAEMEKCGIAYKAIYVDFRKKKLRNNNLSSQSILKLNFSRRKWSGLPKDEVMDFFTSEHFDILLDLTQKKRVLPLDYLLCAADSSLRIGVCNNKYIKYDITISKAKTDVKDKSGVSALELVESIINYLTSIK